MTTLTRCAQTHTHTDTQTDTHTDLAVELTSPFGRGQLKTSFLFCENGVYVSTFLVNPNHEGSIYKLRFASDQPQLGLGYLLLPQKHSQRLS